MFHIPPVLQFGGLIGDSSAPPGTSHCYDMYPNQEEDDEELLAARERIRKFVIGALYNSPDSDNPTISP